MSEQKKLFLLDAYALIYRAYYAFIKNPRINSKGLNTSAVYGFINTLEEILKKENPSHIAVAFDPSGPTFRNELFDQYKSHREETPEVIRLSVPIIKEVISAYNIPILLYPGFEADDVIGTYAKLAEKAGYQIYMMTPDKDYGQLVSENIFILKPKSMGNDLEILGVEEVKQKFQLESPEQVIDLLGLMGDSADNIPGCPGVGEKTAQSLYEAYTSLDDIYAHLDQLPAKVRSKLEENRDTAYLSRDLAQIHTDLSIRLDLEHARADQFDAGKVEKLFRELEFRSLIPRIAALPGGPGQQYQARSTGSGQLSLFEAPPAPAVVVQTTRAAASTQAEIVDTPEKLQQLVTNLNQAAVISFDTETTSTEEMQATIVGISLATQPGSGWYIPLGHRDGPNLHVDQVLDALFAPLTNPSIQKIGHNLKYDYLILARNGLRVTPLSFDTMIAEWLVDANSHNLGLKNLVLARLGEEMTHIEELIGSGRKQISMDQVPVSLAAPYASADAETCLRLMPQLQAELKRDGLEKLFYEIEMPLICVLADMEFTGVLLDLPRPGDERVRIVPVEREARAARVAIHEQHRLPRRTTIG